MHYHHFLRTYVILDQNALLSGSVISSGAAATNNGCVPLPECKRMVRKSSCNFWLALTICHQSFVCAPPRFSARATNWEKLIPKLRLFLFSLLARLFGVYLYIPSLQTKLQRVCYLLVIVHLKCLYMLASPCNRSNCFC